MTTQPRWEDSDQGDLLELVAMGSSTGAAEHEWSYYVECLSIIGGNNDGIINPNRLRMSTRTAIAPKRIGAFTSRAIARGLIEPTGQWVVSDDTQGGNAGRPCRVYRWTGGQL